MKFLALMMFLASTSAFSTEGNIQPITLAELQESASPPCKEIISAMQEQLRKKQERFERYCVSHNGGEFYTCKYPRPRIPMIQPKPFIGTTLKHKKPTDVLTLTLMNRYLLCEVGALTRQVSSLRLQQ